MYSYTFDEETGGILLNSSPTGFSKEPRPVYASEMDLLGFSAYWEYEHQNDTPFMWAESNAYWYKGQIIARIKGGDLYHAPILMPVTDDVGKVILGRESGALQPMNIPLMCEKNKEFLVTLEKSAVKKIVHIYEKYKNKLDIFHVAFSGGKDSAVLLDLVKKALPKDSFVVIFGDTGMEFPDTYKAVDYTEAQCAKEDPPIAFYRARSHFDPEESWKLFGPPARVLRWCCSVHKSTPQTLKMREITGKNNYTGLDFVGVRREESLARSTYDFENFGKKQKGQYSHNPILDWTSAEVWLYIFANKIYINEAYKKGNSRAGCLLCPMSGGNCDFIRRQSYKIQVDSYIKKIVDTNIWENAGDMDTYITSGGWISRRSGRGIKDNKTKYRENVERGIIYIDIDTDNDDCFEWLKTVNVDSTQYTAKKTKQGWHFELNEDIVIKNPSQGKYFRQALKKAAYCVGCRVCETNCKFGKIKFNENGHVSITDCLQCHECHEVPMGCLVYNSLKIPQGERKMKTINCFDDHAPKRDWLVEFFDTKDDFFASNTLGPNMFTHFKRFLRDAELIVGNKCANFTQLISDIGWDTETGLGLMFVNLVNSNAQFEWYVQNMVIDYYYDIQYLKDTLFALDLKEKAINSILKSYKRIVETPFGTVLNFGYVAGDDFVRLKCRIDDNRVVLYALYKFVEKCHLEDREFHLSYLLDEEVERDGVSPARMFGIYDEEEWKSILLGLSSRYPEFINATFTNDLKTILLKDKTSQDVLELFREEL